MSEKIYAWLLRLYPPRFRKAYGAEALQLFRDRARDEKGFFPSLRLWLDLLTDLAISVPSEFRYVQTAFIGASAQRLDGVPSFHVLEGESPRLGALLFGGVLSLVALGAFPVSLRLVVNHHPARTSADPPQRQAYTRRSTATETARQAVNDADENRIASRQPPSAATSFKSGDAKASNFQSKPILAPDSSTVPPPAPQPPPQHYVAGAHIPAVAKDVKLDAAEQQRVINAVIKNLKQHYVDPDIAQKMADALLAHEKRGDDNAEMDGATFAHLLTGQMRDVSHDMHLEVVYSQDRLPDRPLEPTSADLARYRKELEEDNCRFKKVALLPHNIGYLKLNAFPDPSICQTTAVAAMASLNDADAVIFDLQDNRGGEPEMVALIAAYLFDRPEYWYNPRENTTQNSWTRSPVPGNRLADKPIYLLTSSRTFSGAEQFSYDLKMLKRATLVGETTGGAANAGVWYRIDDHFGMGIPETKAINPYSKADWAETGVAPDVKVKAADALETAEKLAESKLRKNTRF